MNFLDFTRFYLILIDFILLFKIAKRGYFLQELRADVAQDPCGCNRARTATWQSHASPCGRLRGADVWQGHASPRGRSGGPYMVGDRLAGDGPTSIGGPS